MKFSFLFFIISILITIVSAEEHTAPAGGSPYANPKYHFAVRSVKEEPGGKSVGNVKVDTDDGHYEKTGRNNIVTFSNSHLRLNWYHMAINNPIGVSEGMATMIEGIGDNANDVWNFEVVRVNGAVIASLYYLVHDGTKMGIEGHRLVPKQDDPIAVIVQCNKNIGTTQPGKQKASGCMLEETIKVEHGIGYEGSGLCLFAPGNGQVAIFMTCRTEDQQTWWFFDPFNFHD